MSLLLIDVGNTRIHWALKSPGQASGPMYSCTYRGEAIDTVLDQHWSVLPPVEQVYVSSVTTPAVNTALRHWLQRRGQPEPQFVVASAQCCGVQNAYLEPEKLGSDRWAAMLGAYALRPGGCCVLDCGTAVTFDVVAASGQHLGGWIMPGYRLFQDTLAQQTAAIGRGEDSPIRSAFLGRSTQQGLDIAWHKGVVSLVEHTVTTSVGEKLHCYITGGDAARLLPLLSDDWCYADDLVLQGLAVMAAQG